MASAFNRDNAIIFTDKITDELLSFQSDMYVAGYKYPIVLTDCLGYKSDNIVSLFDKFLISDDEEGLPLGTLDSTIYGDKYNTCFYYGNILSTSVDSTVVAKSVVDKENIHGISAMSYFDPDQPGCLSFEDKYTATGRVISRTIYSHSDHSALNTLYFDKNGNVVINIDRHTMRVQLNVNHHRRFFNSLIDFLVYCLDANGFSDSSIIFDMLGYNSMAVGVLNDHANAYVCLGRQVSNETITDLNNVSNGHLRNCNYIFVRHAAALIALSRVSLNSDMRMKCLYSIANSRLSDKKVLNPCCAMFVDMHNADICIKLIKSIPDMHFCVILPESTDCICSFNDVNNVEIYGCDRFTTKQHIVDELKHRCSIFFDTGCVLRDTNVWLDNKVLLILERCKSYYPEISSAFVLSEEGVKNKLMSYLEDIRLLNKDIDLQRSVLEKSSVNDYVHMFDCTPGVKDLDVKDLVASCIN